MTSCDRGYAHPSHLFVDSADVDWICEGARPSQFLPALLADRPQLADIGLTPAILALEVMSA